MRLISCIQLEEFLCTTNYVMLFSLLLILKSGMEYVKFISRGFFSGEWSGVYQVSSQDHILDRSIGSIDTKRKHNVFYRLVT